MFTSPQPKIAAIAGLLAGIGTAIKALTDGDPATNPDWGMLAALGAACWGLFTARQNNVTSEQVAGK